MVKEFLSQKGVTYKEYDVSLDQNAARQLVNRTGQMGVPVTVIDGQTIIGYDRVQLERVLSREQRPSLGAAVADASKITAKLGMGITLGAYVGKVKPRSLAERLGLAAGDIITEVNMKRIANADDIENALSRLSRGSRISLVFIRENKGLTTEGVL
ncbi:MAG: PDZ domain-containing protein [Chloroflexi bacterium]|nr:PDZ domain-containing protein [Chloroflexota bacterium]